MGKRNDERGSAIRIGFYVNWSYPPLEEVSEVPKAIWRGLKKLKLKWKMK